MSIEPPLPAEITVDNEIGLRRSFDTPHEELHALIQQNLDHLGPFMFWAKPEYDVAGVRAFMEMKRKAWNESGEHAYSIYYKSELAGSVGVRGFESPVRAATFGYWLSARMQGKGIMTRSVSALLKLVFIEHNMNQAIIHAAPHNTRSRAIPERLGFTEVGRERQMSINVHGEFLDLVNYSLLKSEWEDQPR